MRRVPLSLALVVAACSSDVATSTRNVAPNDQASFDAGGSAPIVFNVQMSADQEPNNASTSESKGHAQVKIFPDGTMEFTFTVNNLSDETYTRAHIHKGPAGINGPIHWDFLEAGNPVPSVAGQPSQLRGIARPRAAAVLADLLAHPDQYYVNVHSTAFPGGAVRGQLP